MKNKDNRTIEQRAEDLTKVLTWCIVHNIKKTYGNLENFKQAYERITNGKPKKIQDENGNITSEQVVFCRRFGFSESTYRRILGGTGSGTYVKLSDAKKFIPKWLHYQPHFNKNFKQPDGSYKTFSVHSYWYLDFDKIEHYLKDENIIDCRSEFYTKLQYKLINKIFLTNKGTEKMTKDEEKQYEKEFAEGIHHLNLKEYKSYQAKKKRQLDKRRMTIAKNAAKKTLADYTMLQMKAQLVDQLQNQVSDYDVKLSEQTEKIRQLEDTIRSLRAENTHKISSEHEEVISDESKAVSVQDNSDIPEEQDEKEESVDIDVRMATWHKGLQHAVFESVIPINIANECMMILGDATPKFRDPRGWCESDAKRNCDAAIKLLVKFKQEFANAVRIHGPNTFMNIDEFISKMRIYENFKHD